MDDIFYFGEDGLRVDEVSIARLAECSADEPDYQQFHAGELIRFPFWHSDEMNQREYAAEAVAIGTAFVSRCDNLASGVFPRFPANSEPKKSTRQTPHRHA